MSHHRLSLAAGVLADFHAPDVAIAACESGFRNVGFTVTPWDAATTSRIRQILTTDNVRVLDVEVVRINADGQVSDDDRRIIDIGGELGAENVLIISLCPDVDKTAEAYASLAEHAQRYGMRACLEFMRFMQVRTLADARAVIDKASCPNSGILIDTLHVARTHEVAQVSEVPRELLSYCQFCDGLAECDDDNASLITDALDDRSVPGLGALPLHDLLESLPPNIPLSLEVRSKDLRERFSDATQRAAHLLEGTRTYLKRIGRSYD